MKNILLTLTLLMAFLTSIAQQKPEIIPGNLIVQVPNKSIDEVVLANQFFNGQPTNLKVNRLLSAPMAAYLLEFNPSINHKKFLQQVWNHPGVTLIQLNHKLQKRAVPNDTQYNQQWWHQNIDSELAWDITTGGVTATGDTIVVCVVDDGGDLDHPDLIANNWVNYNEIPDNNIDDDGNGYIDDYLGWNPVNDNDNVDGGSHGVSVAGMVGAVGNNNTGVTGVNWNVKIMNMTYGSLNDANVVEAYTYPLVMRRQYEETNGALGAFVVATNSSWGIDFGDPADAPIWCAFYDTLGAAGILSAGATANNDVDIDNVGDLPTGCSSEYMISVTASNENDVRTFSGYGATTVDLAAPGEDVRTTRQNGNYTTTSGTSFATPATAGAIALLYSAPCASLASIAHSDPALAAEMVRDAIFDGVDPIANLNGECVTGGRLNVKNSLDIIVNTCADGGCIPPFSGSVSGVTDTEATLQWNALADIDSFNISYGIAGNNGTTVNNLTALEYDLTGLTPCTDYWFTAQAICEGELSDWSDTTYFRTDGCCEAPDGFELIESTETTITATWNSVLAAGSYFIQYREVGTTTWIDADGITNTSYTISGLVGCTDYQVRVASNCDGGTTDFTPSQMIRTFGCGTCTDEDYCESSGDNSQEFIANVTVGMLNNTTQTDADGYGDYTDLSVDLQRGETYDVSFTPDYPNNAWTEHFRVWIDLDQNGIFTSAELLFDDQDGTQSNASGSISIPIDAELGSTRMRVSMAYGSSFGGDYPQSACDEGQDGEVEDYCVNITEEDPVNPGIEEESGLFGMSVYPVPAINFVSVELDEATADVVSLDVLDMQGKVIQTIKTSTKRTRLDVEGLSAGIYVIEARTADEIIGRARMLK